jgi:hypothetical protein
VIKWRTLTKHIFRTQPDIPILAEKLKSPRLLMMLDGKNQQAGRGPGGPVIGKRAPSGRVAGVWAEAGALFVLEESKRNWAPSYIQRRTI